MIDRAYVATNSLWLLGLSIILILPRSATTIRWRTRLGAACATSSRPVPGPFPFPWAWRSFAQVSGR